MDACIEVYVAAFVARCNAMRRPDQRPVAGPGLHGLLPSAEDPRTRLLVTDDRAYDALAGLLPDTRGGSINVIAAAGRCSELVSGEPAWTPDEATAMVCRDLRKIPEPELPTGLTLHPVLRVSDDPPGGVPLEDATALAALAAPANVPAPDELAQYLRSLPSETWLFAAVDGDGTVRATSGSGRFGAEANAFFVNTDPAWQRRGIGRAMTAAALHAALESGARRACLDASDAGLSIYTRLGFEAVTKTTRFFGAV